ncbi:MAG: hypothetical protein ACRDPZ_14225, partial [Gaiellaceae bacterium]
MKGTRPRTAVRGFGALQRGVLWMAAAVALAAGLTALLPAGATAVPPTTSPVNVLVLQSDGITGLAGV